MPGAAG